CPTMYLSSSWTISCGVIIGGAAASGVLGGVAGAFMDLERFDDEVLVGVDAKLARDRERALHDFGGRKLGMVEERERGRLRVGAAAADRDEAALGLEHVPRAADHERTL